MNEDQLVELALEIEEITKYASAISELLNTKSTSKSEKRNDTIYIDFRILSEYQELLDAKLPLPQILAVYHDWAKRTWEMAVINECRLKKGKVRDYVEKCLRQIATIEGLL